MGQIGNLKKNILYIANSKFFMLTIIITTISSYGYIIVNPTLYIDDTAFDFFYKNYGFLAQGRFGPILLNEIFGIYNFNTTLIPLFSVIFLIISGILWSSLFMTLSDNKISKFSCLIFAVFYVSYPLITELFNYDAVIMNLNIGLALLPIVIFIIYSNFENNNKKTMMVSIFLLCFIFSLYESLASVYLLGCFIILILKLIYSNDDNEKSLKYIRSRFLGLLLPLEISVILYFSIYVFLNLIFDMPIDYSEKSIFWLGGIIKTTSELIESMIFSYGINSIYYLPILYLVIVLFIQVFLSFSYFIKYKNYTVIYLFFGIILSLFSMSILRGNAAPYRMCTTFGLFVSFTFMLIVDIAIKIKCKSITRYSIITVIFILLIWQVNDINKWFYVERLKYQEEVNVVQEIGNDIISTVNLDKPVVFIGNYELSDNIKQYIFVDNPIHISDNAINDRYLYKYTQTNILGFLSWSTGSYFYENGPSETHDFFRMLGYDLPHDNKYIYNEVKDMVDQIPSWPKEGYIHETGDYIVVNFGS